MGLKEMGILGERTKGYLESFEVIARSVGLSQGCQDALREAQNAVYRFQCELKKAPDDTAAPAGEQGGDRGPEQAEEPKR